MRLPTNGTLRGLFSPIPTMENPTTLGRVLTLVVIAIFIIANLPEDLI
jgi:hypothetical protein